MTEPNRPASQTPEWYAAEWSGRRLRLWPVTAAAYGTDSATEALPAEPPLEDLRQALDDLGAQQGIPVLADGFPATPVPVPAKPEDLRPARAAPDLYLLPGLSQDQPSGHLPGTARIAGFLGLNPRFDGVLCLPGPFTAWVQVSAGEVVSFQRMATGRLFAGLAPDAEGWDETLFQEALDSGLSDPARLAQQLAQVPDGLRLGRLTPGNARAALSGALIGAELAAARPYWLGQQVAVIGGAALAPRYVAALSRQGLPAIQAQGSQMALHGLLAARARLTEFPA